MSDRTAFLNHIAAHPEADLPRLVFADWLDERGDPLGEFIRVQVELSHRQDRLGDEETQRLLVREDELLMKHRGEWTKGWDVKFERGLPDKVRMDWRDFADFSTPLLDRWPTIKIASLRTAFLLQQPVHEAPLNRVREVHLEGESEEELVEAVVGSPSWNSTTRLRLTLRVEGLAPQLLDLPYQVALSRLDLVQPFPGGLLNGDGSFVDDGIAELVRDMNDAVGREFAVLLRPYERLYPLLGDLGGGFFAGHLKSGASALFGIAPQGRRVAFCTFTGAGRVDKSLWEDTTTPPWTLDRIRDRFGFEWGFIRVREFDAHNRLAVRFWPRAARAIIADNTYDYDPEIAAHLADPQTFAVGFGEREAEVSYRTGRGTGAVG